MPNMMPKPMHNAMHNPIHNPAHKLHAHRYRTPRLTKKLANIKINISSEFILDIIQLRYEIIIDRGCGVNDH